MQLLNIKISDNTVEHIALRFGLGLAMALTGFFFFMKAIGLVHNLELRALNILIMFSFLLMAIKYYQRNHKETLNYLKGVGLGLLTAIIGSLTFAIFTFIYVSFIDPEFMQLIIEREPFGQYLNPFIVAVTIFIEGSASGFLLTYAILQWRKTPHFSSPIEKV